MLPAVTATQIQQGLKDFLTTNFSISSPYFNELLEEFIRNGNAFKGPYLSLGLPFAKGTRGADCFPELRLKYPPYLHQEQAFERLSGSDPASTLVATGTGSGKTECFLYPVLDYCRQHAHKRGIKAILIYPMNALATDQARRIAEFIHATPSLNGLVRAGLYVGQREAHPKKLMGEHHIITDKDVIRTSPPDILLTNYKMLDYMLVRHQDRNLWQFNEPETLKYLVVDELHTFDGAQGTDLACLVRRLKARLNTPANGLCCVGTSATLGSDAGIKHLLQYAEDVFGEPFNETAIIREHRVSAVEFLGDGVILNAMPPLPSDLELLNPENYLEQDSYLATQYGLWFDSDSIKNGVNAEQIQAIQDNKFRVRLGDELKEHLFFQNLVREIKGGIKDFSELLETMRPFFRGITGATEEYRSLVLLSLLSLISHARRTITIGNDGQLKDVILPFLNVRMQFWIRELARMVVSVNAKDTTTEKQPVLRFSTDLPEESPTQYLPLVHCRECGASGWLGLTDISRGYYRTALQPIYASFFKKKDSNFRLFFPDVAEAKEANGEGAECFICGSCRAIHPYKSENGTCRKCHSPNIIKVFIPNDSSKDCPFCKARNSMLLVGARAASLTSAIISLLYASHFNDDKKLITFSDNVQDASHRAGFFGARTYGFTLRSAIQQCLQHQGNESTLAAFPASFTAFWKNTLSTPEYLATFIHPGMEWRQDYDLLKKYGELPATSKLPADIDRRLEWEIYSNYSLYSRIGRTLEKTSASIAYPQPDLVTEATERLTPVLLNEYEELRDITLEQVRIFITGIITHLRQNGAVWLPILNGYVLDWGKPYRMSQQHMPWMPAFGPQHKLPRLLTNRAGVERFEQVFKHSGNKLTWCTMWATKNFARLKSLGISLTQGIYDRMLAVLRDCNLIIEMDVENRGQNHKVWALNPSSLLLTTQVTQYRCNQCGHGLSAASAEDATWVNAPCHRHGCTGKYAPLASKQDYYGKLYCTGDITRLFTAEHTGLLTRDEREATEDTFKSSGEKRQPWFPNLLSCTPTLEMGIDIGDLSSTVQCSVPPSQSNYLQRIGRAGRKDGNALNVTIANAKPHDLYFFESPNVMMAGDVESPGVFLNASAVLERQLTAYCLDRWVMTGITERDIPDKLVSAISAVEKRNEQAFPYNFLRFIETNATDLLDRFLSIFEGKLSPDAQKHLYDFIHGRIGGEGDMAELPPLSWKIVEGIGRVLKERNSLRKKASKGTEEVKKLEADPTGGEATKERIQELKREVAALRSLASAIGQKNIFNFFTDEGLIPNYAFPEQGVTLHSIIYRKKDKADENGNYDVNTFEYERAAQNALTEFAPGNTFYAGKRKVTIDQVDIETSEVTAWRLCPECSYSVAVAQSDGPGPCPNCGSELYADAGQKRQMLRMSQVFATTSEQQSRVADDSDSREPQFYVRQLLVGYSPQDVTEAWRLDTEETVFGYAFLSRANFREINFGEFADDENGLSVAGIDTPKKGFRICAQCGKLLPFNSGPKDHAWGCSSRKEGTKESVLDCVYLYRDFNSEAIKILLPFTGIWKASAELESFIAAFNLGLRLRFGGSISHLRSTLHTEPDTQERALRKQYLVIYDSIPGGTGYLKELMRDARIIEVLEMAYQHLTHCGCGEKQELDGCYRCLLAYRNSSHMQAISKQKAIEILEQILRNKSKLVPAKDLKSVSLGSLFESELEVRFIEALRRQNSEHLRVKLVRQIVNGREGFFLEIGESRWLIEQQVDLGPEKGVAIHSRADFVFTPARSQMQSQPIVVYTDGFTWHKNRLGHDMAQRMAIVRSGRYVVWSLTFHDVQEVFDNKQFPAPDYIKNWSADAKDIIWEKICPDKQMRLESMTSFRMFVRYLTCPESNAWKTAAKAYTMCGVTAPVTNREESLKTVTRYIPEVLAQAALLDGAALFGHHESPQTHRFFSTVQKPQSNSAALCLIDSEEIRDSKEFEGEWTAFLRGYNLFQFLEHSAAITRSGIEAGLYDDLLEKQPKAATERKETEQQAEWNELSELLPLEFHPILAKLIEARAPVPEVGIEVMSDGVVLGELELAWPTKNIGIVTQDYAHLQNEDRLAGWTLYNLADAEKTFSELLTQIA